VVEGCAAAQVKPGRWAQSLFGKYSMDEIVFQRAGGSDLSEILRLVKEAALWLKMKNINYWQDWINPPEKFINWIKIGFERNEFYLMKQGISIIGCFRLSGNDEVFWGKQDSPAYYIHSFTIDRKLNGKNLGIKVIQKLGNICKESRKKYLRLDCSSTVSALKQYYEELGFSSVGETIVHGEILTLYEKEIV
jgi:predicted GNAT family N-acyltransferase